MKSIMISKAPDKLRDYTIKTTENQINLQILVFQNANMLRVTQMFACRTRREHYASYSDV